MKFGNVLPYSPMATNTPIRPNTLREALKRRALLPASWKKAAGILRGRKPDALNELKKMRKEWNKRTGTLEKLWHR